MWGVLKQNLSYSFRHLLKNKGFAVTAVLTLGLGNQLRRCVMTEDEISDLKFKI